MKLALAVLAAVFTAQSAARAQDGDSGFGHFGNFSSAQGSAAQWSATAPGMYASGEYAYVGPFAVVYRSPSRPYAARIRLYNSPIIYVPSSAANTYEPGPFPDFGTERSVNAYRPGENRLLNDLERRNYDRGFSDGYSAALRSAAPPRTESYQGNHFSAR
jgi:hypothetical protein